MSNPLSPSNPSPLLAPPASPHDPLERLPTKPVLLKELTNQTAVLGNDTAFECRVLSDGPPFLAWYWHLDQDLPRNEKGYPKDSDEGNNATILLLKVPHPRRIW